MSGPVKQFVDFSGNTNNDSGENSVASILPLQDGESLNGANISRADESMRQRSEAIRSVMSDTLYLRDADRRLVIAGPGTVTWPGSTTAAASGIPVISDTLWLIPMLTPGSAQTPPVPPVASAFGVIHLKRASDSLNSIAVASLRRSYAAGDQISITVSAGGSFSCTLDAEVSGQLRRTIKIVATGSTTLSTTITALNALTPPAPDNTALVSAALEGGAANGDLLLTSQARQYMAGNWDGEGHTLTPANLASFFSSNPTSALAEGDSLCLEYDMVNDPASTGGRRQSIPENSNTTMPAGSYFNSRLHPEKLPNAIPICKVINGNLVFSTGVEVRKGDSGVAISSPALPDLFKWDSTTPASEGTLTLQRPDQTYDASHLPPAFAPLGRLLGLGSKLLATTADARKARIDSPFSSSGSDVTLLWQSAPATGTVPAMRAYMSFEGSFIVTLNALFGGTTFAKDLNGTAAYALWFYPAQNYVQLAFHRAGDDSAWGAWQTVARWAGPEATSLSNPAFAPLYKAFDSSANARNVVDHLGFPNSHLDDYYLDFYAVKTASFTNVGTGSHAESYTEFKKGPGTTLTVAANLDKTAFQGDILFDQSVHADSVAVAEWALDCSALTGTPALTADFGWIGDVGTPAIDNNGSIKFKKTSASANWFVVIQTSNAVTSSTDSGVAAGGVQRFRLEWYGANHPGGKRVEAYINGVLVAESTDATKMMTGDPPTLAGALRSTGAAGSVHVSPMHNRRRWLLADDPV